MKVIKSDGRYNFYRLGFTVIMEYQVKRSAVEQKAYRDAVKVLDTRYGPIRNQVPGQHFKYTMNENYRVQLMSDGKRRRIYLRDEAEVTLILLMVGA